MNTNLQIEDHDALKFLFNNEVYIVSESKSYKEFELKGTYEISLLNIINHQITEPDFTLLTNIIGNIKINAQKIDIGKTGILNLSNYPEVSINNIISVLKPTHIILWGVSTNLSLNYTLFSHHFYNGCTIINSTDLGSLNQHVEQKSKLWAIIKHVFKL